MMGWRVRLIRVRTRRTNGGAALRLSPMAGVATCGRFGPPALSR